MVALIALGVVVVLFILVASASVRVAREYERGVIFRLGRLKSPPKGPGLFLLIPIIDKMVRVDLRTVTLNVPPQEVITKDNVPVRVNAVAYFRIIDPERAIVQVENFMVATSQIAQTTLRSVLGQHMLDELLSERDKINTILQQIIDEATSPWGVKVSIVEVKDVEIPGGMQRAMARQAEAERERRAKVIAAEGEFQASEQLKNAAQVLAENPMSLQLRFLQTMLEISSERSSTIILPLPIELFKPFLDAGRTRPPQLTEIREDPLTGRRVVFAPGRRDRPGAWLPEVEPPTEQELESCPFCAGREDRTPPETLRIGDPWRVRVVPNLYPAFERQEVVIHSPEHVRSFAELGDDQVALVAEAWELRIAGASAVLALVNEGRLAGASLPHTHSQLVWTQLPHESLERLAELLAVHELARRNGVVAAVHPVGASPYECLIAPEEGEGGALADGLVLLRDLVRKLRAAEGARPWNAWLHPGPPWHLHFVPRLTAIAGIELGAGIYVNVMPPERAAETLRSSGG